MDYVLLGQTGMRISQLALGTMSFGGDADKETSGALYRRCREAGINFFDTADMYGRGASEAILGELIQSERDQIVLATKAYFPMGEGPNDRGASRYHLVRAVEASLRRLRTDRIDLFFLHRMDDETAMDETLRAVEDLVRSGKILHPAVSNFAAWETAKAIGLQALHHWAPMAAIQPMYNLVKRQAEVELLPMAKSEGLAVLPYSPLGAGLLTGKYGPGTRPPSGRLVDNDMYATRFGESSMFDIAVRFTTLCQERGLHPVSVAIAWVAAHPAVTAPLLGARDLVQLEPALDAVNVPMEQDLWDAISALSPRPPPATDRNEETA